MTRSWLLFHATVALAKLDPPEDAGASSPGIVWRGGSCIPEKPRIVEYTRMGSFMWTNFQYAIVPSPACPTQRQLALGGTLASSLSPRLREPPYAYLQGRRRGAGQEVH